VMAAALLATGCDDRAVRAEAARRGPSVQVTRSYEGSWRWGSTVAITAYEGCKEQRQHVPPQVIDADDNRRRAWFTVRIEEVFDGERYAVFKEVPRLETNDDCTLRLVRSRHASVRTHCERGGWNGSSTVKEGAPSLEVNVRPNDGGAGCGQQSPPVKLPVHTIDGVRCVMWDEYLKESGKDAGVAGAALAATAQVSMAVARMCLHADHPFIGGHAVVVHERVPQEWHDAVAAGEVAAPTWRTHSRLEALSTAAVADQRFTREAVEAWVRGAQIETIAK
jgi:hypothetical protein